MPDAMEHIRQLSAAIGGRGSCTPAERRAAEYAVGQMRAMGLADVRIETFRGSPSTYRPFVLFFGAGLLGTLLAWLVDGPWAMVAAALLSALGTWGMLAETEFATNWARMLLPRAASQNVVGILRPRALVRRQVVLCAHLDTHRTPVFYRSRAWNRLFAVLVLAAFASLAASCAACGLGALLAWAGARWVGLASAPVELFALVVCLSADHTPFSPGANDDASGVASVLAVAERLLGQPLERTEVWLALTGCEEVSCYGMAAFLDENAAQLGRGAVFVVLDLVGIGQLTYLTADGLIRKRRTHPRALALARAAAQALPNLVVRERAGLAYTDGLVATKRGLVALTLCSQPAPGSNETAHWHQMSDTLEQIDPESVAQACAFAWQVLQEIDRDRPAVARPQWTAGDAKGSSPC